MTRWQTLPIVPDDTRAEMVAAARRIQSTLFGIRTQELDHLARRYGVTLRTLQRYMNDKYPCPGYPEGSCLTNVQGGGLCRYCQKTKAAA
jgi:hypothetical protein